jgi:hypothetical protein
MLIVQVARARDTDRRQRAERACFNRQLLASRQPDQTRRDTSLRRRSKRNRFATTPAIEA